MNDDQIVGLIMLSYVFIGLVLASLFIYLKRGLEGEENTDFILILTCWFPMLVIFSMVEIQMKWVDFLKGLKK